ncbi:MAG: formylglycine-generating enzyme family protein [bacterium]|nr:formylglycine-generating enzyme family protein [bacterium]
MIRSPRVSAFTFAVYLIFGSPGAVLGQSAAQPSDVGERPNHDPRLPAVGPVTVVGEARLAVAFSIRWPNGFRSTRNHDAVWLVVRGPDGRRAPLELATAGHEVAGAVAGVVVPSDDRLGAIVEPTADHQGSVDWRVQLRLAAPAPQQVAVWAVGMVFVPGGAFEAGDDHPTALRFGAIHTLVESAAAPLHIRSEAELAVGREVGELWYDTNQYMGDQQGPLPGEWPKGTRAFYVMKRELTQGFYARYLNALPTEWQQRRAPLALTGRETETCSIVEVDGRFVAQAPMRPCNFVSWRDSCALLDWLALRPMSELEFEKAARGPSRPCPLDYPWGTGSREGVERTVERTRDLRSASVAAEAGFDATGRVRLGASFYGVLDLSGSVWERVVSLGHPIGRAFRGTHGDGVLSAAGDATNADWPAASADDKSAFGIGYRGGAEYFAAAKPDNPTNPASPVALRTYGAWEGAARYKTYSARGCRTANRIPTGVQRAALHADLEARVERDQRVRGAFERVATATKAERAEIFAAARRVDRDNTAFMMRIVDRFGWPTDAMFGSGAARAAFLMVQHADHEPEFQARCLPILTAAAERGEASKVAVAYLTDRVRVKQHRPQLYGTQYQTLRSEDGKGAVRDENGKLTYLLPIVEEVDELDSRRAAVGLPPWREYEAQMAAMQKREPATQPRPWDGKLPARADRR